MSVLKGTEIQTTAGIVVVPEDTGEQIFVDPRLKPKRRFEVVIHEFLHHRFPAWTEEHVTSEAKHMTNFLWKHGYRKVDQ